MDYDVVWTANKIIIIPGTKEKAVIAKSTKWTAPIEKGKEIILSERTKPRGLASIEFSGMFVAFDQEQYNKITAKDFIYVLNKLGLPLKSKKAHNLLKKLRKH